MVEEWCRFDVTKHRIEAIKKPAEAGFYTETVYEQYLIIPVFR
jgi:hypothetical protein